MHNYVAAKYEFEKIAEKEIGQNRWDSATGTIAGVCLAFLIIILMYGFDDYEAHIGTGFLVFLVIAGSSGFFIGRKKQEKYYEKVRLRALQLEALDKAKKR